MAVRTISAADFCGFTRVAATAFRPRSSAGAAALPEDRRHGKTACSGWELATLHHCWHWPTPVRFFTADVLAEYRSWSHRLITTARQQLLQIPDVTSFCTPAETDFVSMAAVELPQTAGWKPGYHGHPDSLQVQLPRSVWHRSPDGVMERSQIPETVCTSL
jgi:hypothetical protein